MAGKHSHKRATARRRPRAALIAGPLAVLATGAAVATGVIGTEPAQDLFATDPSVAAGSVGDGTRDLGTISRGGDRQAPDQPDVKPLSKVDKLLTKQAVRQAVQGADTKMWTTETLNLWTRPDGKADKVGEIDAGKKVLVTGRTAKDREEVVLDGESRWVTAGYLDDEKPADTEGIGGECTNGTSVKSGVSASIVKIHQAVCARWPEVSTYGTLRADSGDHGSGRAVDIMISGAVGWEIAEYVRANYQALGVSYVIYEQKIWSVERSGEGWRGMSDRGSATANHFDHVHVSVY